jgi:hypothetical protein
VVGDRHEALASVDRRERMPKSFGRKILILFRERAWELEPRQRAVVDEAGNGAAAVVGESEDEQPVRVAGRVIMT